MTHLSAAVAGAAEAVAQAYAVLSSFLLLLLLLLLTLLLRLMQSSGNRLSGFLWNTVEVRGHTQVTYHVLGESPNVAETRRLGGKVKGDL